jgi:hypothetical protein
MFFEVTVDPFKRVEMQEHLVTFADGLEKATQDRMQEAMEWGRARTVREIATDNAVRLSRFYTAFDIDPASMYGTSETVTGSLYIDDTATIPLNAFRATQTQIGVVVDFDKNGNNQVIYPKAFGPEIKKLGRNIYQRVGKKSYPIEKIADLKAKEIPGITDKLQKMRGPIRERMLRKIEADKKRLVADWNQWHSQ